MFKLQEESCTNSSSWVVSISNSRFWHVVVGTVLGIQVTFFWNKSPFRFQTTNHQSTTPNRLDWSGRFTNSSYCSCKRNPALGRIIPIDQEIKYQAQLGVHTRNLNMTKGKTTIWRCLSFCLMVMFHCHVLLLEGNLSQLSPTCPVDDTSEEGRHQFLRYKSRQITWIPGRSLQLVPKENWIGSRISIGKKNKYNEILTLKLLSDHKSR